jgi:hypothetical protein
LRNRHIVQILLRTIVAEQGQLSGVWWNEKIRIVQAVHYAYSHSEQVHRIENTKY